MSTQRLNLPEIVVGQQSAYITHNEALQKLDVLVQCAVSSMDVTNIEATASTESDRKNIYIMASSADNYRGANPRNHIAYYNDNSNSWEFIQPTDGFIVWNLSDSQHYYYTDTGKDSSWRPYEPTKGDPGRDADPLELAPFITELDALKPKVEEALTKGGFEFANYSVSRGRRKTLGDISSLNNKIICIRGGGRLQITLPNDKTMLFGVMCTGTLRVILNADLVSFNGEAVTASAFRDVVVTNDTSPVFFYCANPGVWVMDDLSQKNAALITAHKATLDAKIAALETKTDTADSTLAAAKTTADANTNALAVVNSKIENLGFKVTHIASDDRWVNPLRGKTFFLIDTKHAEKFLCFDFELDGIILPHDEIMRFAIVCQGELWTGEDIEVYKPGAAIVSLDGSSLMRAKDKTADNAHLVRRIKTRSRALIHFYCAEPGIWQTDSHYVEATVQKERERISKNMTDIALLEARVSRHYKGAAIANNDDGTQTITLTEDGGGTTHLKLKAGGGSIGDSIKVDTINEYTSNSGVTIDGVLLHNSRAIVYGGVKTDTITETTSNAGVTIEGVTIRDSHITAQGRISGVDIVASNSVKVDTINEYTANAGVIIEGVLIKDGSIDGVVGEKGDKGDPGDPGDKGDKGDKGEPGSDGVASGTEFVELAITPSTTEWRITPEHDGKVICLKRRGTILYLPGNTRMVFTVLCNDVRYLTLSPELSRGFTLNGLADPDDRIYIDSNAILRFYCPEPNNWFYDVVKQSSTILKDSTQADLSYLYDKSHIVGNALDFRMVTMAGYPEFSATLICHSLTLSGLSSRLTVNGNSVSDTFVKTYDFGDTQRILRVHTPNTIDWYIDDGWYDAEKNTAERIQLLDPISQKNFAINPSPIITDLPNRLISREVGYYYGIYRPVGIGSGNAFSPTTLSVDGDAFYVSNDDGVAKVEYAGVGSTFLGQLKELNGQKISVQVKVKHDTTTSLQPIIVTVESPYLRTLSNSEGTTESDDFTLRKLEGLQMPDQITFFGIYISSASAFSFKDLKINIGDKCTTYVPRSYREELPLVQQFIEAGKWSDIMKRNNRGVMTVREIYIPFQTRKFTPPQVVLSNRLFENKDITRDGFTIELDSIAQSIQDTTWRADLRHTLEA